MHTLSDEKLTELLDACPSPDGAVKELFERARAESQARLFLSVLDVERVTLKQAGQDKNHIVINYARGWTASQVGKLYGAFAEVPSDATEADEELIRYLQLLSYSQIWECLAIQRLLWSVTRTACGKQYDPNLLLKDDPGTAKVIQRIALDASGASLAIASLLSAVYHNLIRNAFSHSDVLTSQRAISTAPDVTSRGPTFHMKFETWDRLFALIGQFLHSLFRERRVAEGRLAELSQFTFNLPEFKGPFRVKLDSHKRWIFDQ